MKTQIQVRNGGKIMTFKTENIIEITWIVKEYAMNGNLLCIPYTELKEIIDTISDRFETLHCNTDWNELDYSEEICNFTNKEIALELWHRFGDVPMDPDTEELEEFWNGFFYGTFREDIWHWFEETFHVSVAEDLIKQS